MRPPVSSYCHVSPLDGSQNSCWECTPPTYTGRVGIRFIYLEKAEQLGWLGRQQRATAQQQGDGADKTRGCQSIDLSPLDSYYEFCVFKKIIFLIFGLALLCAEQ